MNEEAKWVEAPPDRVSFSPSDGQLEIWCACGQHLDAWNEVTCKCGRIYRGEVTWTVEMQDTPTATDDEDSE